MRHMAPQVETTESFHKEKILNETRIKQEAELYDLDLNRELHVLDDKLKMINLVLNGKKEECDSLKFYSKDCYGYTTMLEMWEKKDCSGYSEEQWIRFCEALLAEDVKKCDAISEENLKLGCRYFIPRLERIQNSNDSSFCDLALEEAYLDAKEDIKNYSPRTICIALFQKDSKLTR